MLGNDFRGMVPQQWSHLSKLTDLDLSYNVLTGTLPAYVSVMTGLQSLRMTDNYFYGELPVVWPSMGVPVIAVTRNYLLHSQPNEDIEALNSTMCAPLHPQNCDALSASL